MLDFAGDPADSERMHLLLHGAHYDQLSSFLTWVILIGAVYGFLRMLRDLYLLWIAIFIDPTRYGGRRPD